MLLLTRKVKQKIYIDTPSGERLEIIVNKILNSSGFQPRVSIGINAPTEYRITREELLLGHETGEEQE